MERTNGRDTQGEMVCRKKPRTSEDSLDLFDTLPDDVVMVILGKLSSSARSPQEFINVLSTCKRLKRLALQPAVLKEAGMKTVAVRAKNWSNNAHRFLVKCGQAGSIEATYFLGMIVFYCMEARNFGTALLAKAARKNHAPAQYSLAIILFNGSGGSKDFRAASSLWASAAELNHIESMRELSYCLENGYGFRQNVKKAQSLLILATKKETVNAARASAEGEMSRESLLDVITSVRTVPGFNPGFGHVYSTPNGLQFSPREKQPANLFLLEWFEMRGLKPDGLDSGRVGDGLGLCSDAYCGRMETGAKEFRRCRGCAKARYCSRGCQAHDWKLLHKFECSQF